MIKKLLMHAGCFLLAMLPCASAADYTVLVSKHTRADKDWSSVADALIAKHPGARLIEFDAGPAETLAALRESPPHWLCWVATPGELGKQAVADIHQLARNIDEDPYTDAFWGIVTGYDAASALAVAKHAEPLVVRNVAASTEFAMQCVEQGTWFSELNQGEVWTKTKGGKPVKSKGDADSTASITRCFNKEKPDAILTSGHATQNDWQPGYSYKNGFFTHQDGTIIGKALDKTIHTVDSPNPKVYLGIGNCLIGNVPGKPGCMATAWMKCGGVKQFLGYTVPTWFGYGGWGVLDYFIEQPARFSLTESFIANQHALDWKLGGNAAEADIRGLKHDRDVVAFYGDPKWDARLAPGTLRWTEEFKESQPGIFTWTITPTAGADSFATVNSNGSQRGGRPLVRFLPKRSLKTTILEGADWKPVAADDFILLPRPEKPDGPITIRIKVE